MSSLILQTDPELHSIDEPPTLVTLITTSFWVAAVRTVALYEAVGQETLTVLTAQLLHCVFHQESMLVETPENILGYPEKNNRGMRWLKDSFGVESLI